MNSYLIPKPFRIHELLYIKMFENKLLVYDISGLVKFYSIYFFPLTILLL